MHFESRCSSKSVDFKIGLSFSTGPRLWIVRCLFWCSDWLGHSIALFTHSRFMIAWTLRCTQSWSDWWYLRTSRSTKIADLNASPKWGKTQYIRVVDVPRCDEVVGKAASSRKITRPEQEVFAFLLLLNYFLVFINSRWSLLSQMQCGTWKSYSKVHLTSHCRA